MIVLKSPDEIAHIAKAGAILAKVFKELKARVWPGAATRELDELARKLVFSLGAEPAFLEYPSPTGSKPFPASICISINDEIVHGLPSSRVLQDGDIVGLDFGVRLDGWYADGATTIGVGKISPEAKKLLKVTERALQLGIRAACAGNRIGDIGYAVQSYVEAHGLSIIRDLVGHGIGRALHEEPQVPNFGLRGTGALLTEGMVIAIEPMVAAGDWKLEIAPDGWTYRTQDRSLTAHFEHTVAITKKEPRVLTK